MKKKILLISKIIMVLAGLISICIAILKYFGYIKPYILITGTWSDWFTIIINIFVISFILYFGNKQQK